MQLCMGISPGDIPKSAYRGRNQALSTMVSTRLSLHGPTLMRVLTHRLTRTTSRLYTCRYSLAENAGHVILHILDPGFLT